MQATMGEKQRQQSSQQTPQQSQRRSPLPPKPPFPPGQGDPSRFLRAVLLWLGIFASVIFFYIMFQSTNKVEWQISYTKYLELLENDKIASAVITKSEFNDFEFHGTLKKPIQIQIDGKPRTIRHFVTKLGIVDSETEKLWRAHGITWTYEEKESPWWNMFISILPWIALLALYFIIVRRMANNAPGRNIFSFGKSRARVFMPSDSNTVTFKDVAGAEEAKYELYEIIEFLKDPQKFQRLGGKIPRGVLLLGPPGTGKTLLARAVAGEANVPFFWISGADFVEMFVGVGASRVRDLFEQAKRHAPCIIFIDEIDAVGRQRGAGLGGGHDEREQTLNQLLVEMDGFEPNTGIIVIAATNRPDILDPALLRPGRFDRQIVVDRPDVKGRLGILEVHTRNIPIAEDVDLETIARSTPGFSGADLANLVNEAALAAARHNRPAVTMADFEYAKDKILMGVERRSLVISEKEKEITAYHEMGHALLGKFLPHADPVHKVTIIPRGRALGVTSYLPDEDKHTYTKEYIEDRIVILLGGRAAEKLVFQQLSTGAADDLKRATELARKMVCEWGMSERIGPIHFDLHHEEIFLAREVAQPRNFSEATAQLIDQEISKILREAESKAEAILRENLDLLHTTAKILLTQETIEGEELDMIIKDYQRYRSESSPPEEATSSSTSTATTVTNNGQVPDEAPASTSSPGTTQSSS